MGGLDVVVEAGVEVFIIEDREVGLPPVVGG
jgi:hypothetical protein